MPARIGYSRARARKLLKDAGQNTIPVNLKAICMYLGFQYVEVEHFQDSLSALCVEQAGMKYAAVNKRHSLHRKRFSLAHELGHWVLGHTREYSLEGITIDSPPDPSEVNTKNKIEETEANEFAGELLVPHMQLKKNLDRIVDINRLSSLFEVSPEVMTIRIMAARAL
jgi:Zn-dependent peptidase ImmA (M78 family)